MIFVSPVPRRRRVQACVLALTAVAGFLSFTLAPASAFAYVRYRSESDCPYSWRTRSIRITGFPQGLAGMTIEQITDAAMGATAVWSKGDPALASCTDLDLTLTMKPVSAAPPAAIYDHRNNLMIRSDTWCVVAANGSEDCHDPSALAITSVFARTWGQIVDADIEVNGVNFVWADLLSSGAAVGSQDLQNALAHEMGHLIGLDHTCSLDPDSPAAKDNHGLTVPNCTGAPDAVRATTMFASANPGDVSKRDLEPDDQQAVCDTYPLGATDTLACAAPDSGGCGIASVAVTAGTGSIAQRFGWGVAIGALAAVAFVAVRRRSRRH